MNTPKDFPVVVDSFDRFTIFYNNNKNCAVDISVKDTTFLKLSKGLLFAHRSIDIEDAVFYNNGLTKINGLDYAIYYNRSISYNQSNYKNKAYTVVASTILPTANWITLEFECFGGVNCDSTFFESSIAALKTVLIKDAK